MVDLGILLVMLSPFASLVAMSVLDPRMAMRGKGPPWIWEAMTGVLVLVLFLSLIAIVGFVYPFLRARLRREKIIVTPQGVRVESRSFIRKTVVEAAADAIKEITIAPPRSDHLTKTSFGHFAPKEVIRLAETSPHGRVRRSPDPRRKGLVASGRCRHHSGTFRKRDKIRRQVALLRLAGTDE